MLMMKICGLLSLALSFLWGIRGYIEHSDKKNTLGVVVSYILVISSMFGGIYLLNH